MNGPWLGPATAAKSPPSSAIFISLFILFPVTKKKDFSNLKQLLCQKSRSKEERRKKELSLYFSELRKDGGQMRQPR
jgi:hypothetical protein